MVLPSRGEVAVQLPEGLTTQGRGGSDGAGGGQRRGGARGWGARGEAAGGGRCDQFLGRRVSRRHFISQAYNLSLDQLT